MRWFSLTLTRRLALAIGGLLLGMLVLLASLAYTGLRWAIEAHLPDAAWQANRLRSTAQQELFLQAENSAVRLHDVLLQRLAAWPEAQAQLEFDRLFARSADGVWRVRPNQLDTLHAPTLYLQHGDQGPSVSARHRAVVSYHLLKDQGPALVPPFFSAYVDFIEKGLMVFSPGIDWGGAATPDTDNFGYPTMQGADPVRNPGRQPFWTPVYFDDQARAWMVSVIRPLDWQGRWVGTVGHDITIDTLLGSVGSEASPDGSVRMIVSAQGDVIAHPQWRDRIAQAQGQLSAQELADPVVRDVVALIQAPEPHARSLAKTQDGSHWVAWARMAGPPWYVVTVLPQRSMDLKIHKGVGLMFVVGLVCLALALWIMRRMIHAIISRPLRVMVRAVDDVGAGRQHAPVQLHDDTEFGRLAQAFNHMVQELDLQKVSRDAYARALEAEVVERRQAEDQVRQLNLSLESRVQQRTEDLQRLTEQLQTSLSQLKQAQDELVRTETLAGLGRMVAGVAHEMNTPLGNALLSSDTAQHALMDLQVYLQSAAVRRSETARRMAHCLDCLQLCQGNLRRAADLVADFKQVSVDRASLQWRSFDLREVLEDTLGLMSVSLRQKSCLVHLDAPSGVEMASYPGPLGQVVTNVVNNALVHAFEGVSKPQIWVRVVWSAEQADELGLELRDNGVGMRREVMAQVFQPFFTTRLGQGGSGLGMHIVYTLVREVLGGQITLDSEPGQGTRVWLQLPVRLPPP